MIDIVLNVSENAFSPHNNKWFDCRTPITMEMVSSIMQSILRNRKIRIRNDLSILRVSHNNLYSDSDKYTIVQIYKFLCACWSPNFFWILAILISSKTAETLLIVRGLSSLASIHTLYNFQLIIFLTSNLSLTAFPLRSFPSFLFLLFFLVPLPRRLRPICASKSWYWQW